jgi:hypothetical protein
VAGDKRAIFRQSEIGFQLSLHQNGIMMTRRRGGRGAQPRTKEACSLPEAQMCSELASARGILMLWPVLFFSISGSAQNLEGRFYPDKDSYMVGEPMLFDVEIKNTGGEVVYLNAKSPGKCLDRYEFFVSGPGSGCGATWNAECADDLVTLKPGESDRGQWPLDFWYRFEHDGKYEVNATRHVPISSERSGVQDFSFSSKFELKLEPPDAVRVQSILQDFERNLYSNDPDVCHTALDVLATTAPIYFQRIALRLAQDKDAFAVIHAVGALERMNTPETRAALADVITKREATSKDEITARIRAIEGLGHCGDTSYQSLVARYMEDKNEYVQLAAMAAVAQLGKASAVPELQHFLSSSDSVTRKNAAYALRFSNTREAVTVLIDSLADKDVAVRERVATSLTELTGHSVEAANGAGASPEELQKSWRGYWRDTKGAPPLPELEFLCRMK